MLAQVKHHRPETRTGLLVGARGARRAARGLRESGADFLLPHVSLAGTGIVEWAAGHGLAVWLWTVNDDRALRAAQREPARRGPHHRRARPRAGVFTSC